MHVQQWEFILTAWKLGMYGFYYTRGRWMHGPQFKYPALRFAGVSEKKISPHLYLKWNQNGSAPEIPMREPRLVAKHSGATRQELSRLQDGQPFNVLGVTRVEKSGLTVIQ